MCASWQFAPNKKWAISPLISPPAGQPTANEADKLARIPRILRIAAKLNAGCRILAIFATRLLFKVACARLRRICADACTGSPGLDCSRWRAFRTRSGLSKIKVRMRPIEGDAGSLGKGGRRGGNRIDGNCLQVGKPITNGGPVGPTGPRIPQSDALFMVNCKTRSSERGCEICSMPQIGDCPWCQFHETLVTPSCVLLDSVLGSHSSRPPVD